MYMWLPHGMNSRPLSFMYTSLFEALKLGCKLVAKIQIWTLQQVYFQIVFKLNTNFRTIFYKLSSIFLNFFDISLYTLTPALNFVIEDTVLTTAFVEGLSDKNLKQL